MTLYSGVQCPYSHRVRMVLAEKDIDVDIIDVEGEEPPEDLLELNPYGLMPTLMDRDLVLYDSQIIMEYLDERYPHPPLLPPDPVARACLRLYIFRIQRDWYSQLGELAAADAGRAGQARKALKEGLMAIAPVFEHKRYFMSDDFTLVDCVLAPLLWRLPLLGVELDSRVNPLVKYAERVFARPAFKRSLTAQEKGMRKK